jgi:hypothetical protein
MSGRGTIGLMATMESDETISFSEIVNDTEGAAVYDDEAREFVAYQGKYVFLVIATNFVPVITFADQPPNVTASVSNMVVLIRNDNDTTTEVQEVSFTIHPSGLPRLGDPTILNNPLPPPDGLTLPVQESAVTAVRTQ